MGQITPLDKKEVSQQMNKRRPWPPGVPRRTPAGWPKAGRIPSRWGSTWWDELHRFLGHPVGAVEGLPHAVEVIGVGHGLLGVVLAEGKAPGAKASVWRFIPMKTRKMLALVLALILALAAGCSQKDTSWVAPTACWVSFSLRVRPRAPNSLRMASSLAHSSLAKSAMYWAAGVPLMVSFRISVEPARASGPKMLLTSPGTR